MFLAKTGQKELCSIEPSDKELSNTRRLALENNEPHFINI